MLWIAAVLCLLFTPAGRLRAHNRQHPGREGTGGFGNGLEALVLYLRNEVVLPNVGPHGNAFVPFLLTLFFFILFANLLGLIPYGCDRDRKHLRHRDARDRHVLRDRDRRHAGAGEGYINTIVFWPHDMSLRMKLFISPILTPIEIIGKFTKPFALAIRLFANMIGGPRRCCWR